MNFFEKIRETIMKFFRTDAEKEFNVEFITSPEIENSQQRWNDIINGSPFWVDPKNKDIRTINFAKFLCQYTAKKACMDLSVSITGSERADFINKCIRAMVDTSIRDKVEDMLGVGGIILKPNGSMNPDNMIDYIMPWDFAITEKTNNGDIRGCIFINRLIKDKVYYYRLEYHHFTTSKNKEGEEMNVYEIQNRAFKSNSSNSLGKKIELHDVPEWSSIDEVVHIANIEKPLFAYLKTPFNNTIDYSSPEGISIFSNALMELRDLDIAWSKKGNEVEDSQHITFIDENALTKQGKGGTRTSTVELPRFVKGLKLGLDSKSTIDEHVPTMLTSDRITDINSILSMISTKCGFSQGQFILDRKSGRLTATQVESDDNETVETINDIRKSIKTALKNLIYAINVFCDLYGIPAGYVDALDDDVPDEDIFYFKDLLASFEQDRSRAYNLMIQGVYSKRKYLKEYEGFNDDEVDAMFAERAQEEAERNSGGLFGEE